MAFARMPDELQQLNPVALQEFAERAGEGPVALLVLIDLKPNAGRDRYAEYGAAVRPLLERAGARVVYAGAGTAALIGPSKWDLVLLVEFPTRQAFLDMVTSPEFLEIAGLRAGALERSELHPLDPADVDGVI